MAVPDVQEILRMLDEGRETEAIGRLEAAIPREATNASMRVLLARAYERVGRLGDAVDAWNTALFLAPGSATARSGVRRLRAAYPDLISSAPPLSPTTPAVSSDDGERFAAPATSLPIDSNAEPDDSAPAPVEAAAAADDVPGSNLDRLIERLQGARIVPDPDFEANDIDLTEPDDDEGLVSETLARIYAAQQQYPEAAQVYEILAEQQPERADEFRAKAREMKMRGSG